VLFFNSKIHYHIRTWGLLLVLGVFSVFLGVDSVLANPGLVAEKRKVTRVQAVYLKHLINFTHWDARDLPGPTKLAKILLLGEDKNGMVETFQYLVSESKLKIGGRSVEVIHFKNPLATDAIKELEANPSVIFLLPKSNPQAKKIRDFSQKSLLVGNGRDLVEKQLADIAFTISKNRVRLVIRKQSFTRKSPMLSSRISNLRNVVEVIP
jgi:hypothetical protein